MGTANFHVVNASQHFVLDYGDDAIAWMECQDELASRFKSFLKDEKGVEFFKNTEMPSQHELRSFCASPIGIFSEYAELLGVQIEINVKAFMRAGYYEASVLDWEIDLYINNDLDYNYDNEDTFLFSYDDREDLDITQGTWNLHKKRLENLIEATAQKVIAKAEECFGKVAETYGVVAQASNGETLYAKTKEGA